MIIMRNTKVVGRTSEQFEIEMIRGDRMRTTALNIEMEGTMGASKIKGSKIKTQIAITAFGEDMVIIARDEISL